VAWDGAAICAGVTAVLLILLLRRAREDRSRTPVTQS